MRRRGYTLLESLVAAAIGLGVLAAMVSILSMTRRMSNAGDLASALAEASIAMETLHRDLGQAVQRPDPANERIVRVSKDPPVLEFLRGERAADGSLTATLVAYRREKLTSGQFKIVRQVGGAAATALPGTYTSIRADTFSGAGGPFIRLTLHVAAREAAGSDEAVLTTLIRLGRMEMLNSGLVRFRWLDGLEKVALPPMPE